nr:hypothetical protein [Bacteroidota bacterium]
MNKKYIFFIFCLIAWMGLYSQGHHPEREFNKSVDGKYLVDSTYIYLGNTFGQYWFNYLRYKVTERDQYGNFKKASDFEYDTINAVWYEKMRYEAQHYDSSTRRLWLGHTWDSKAGNWKMSDSIYSNPNGSIEISWY